MMTLRGISPNAASTIRASERQEREWDSAGLAVVATENVMELDHHPEAHADDDLHQKGVVDVEQVAAEKEIGQAPEHGRDEVQDEVPLLLLPWSVKQRHEQQRDIGYRRG